MRSAAEKRSDLGELALALWLINSDLNNPMEEDILNWAGTTDLNEAEKKLHTELKKRGLEKVYTEIELPLIPILGRAQERGILVDKDKLKEISKEYHHKLSGIEGRIYKAAETEFNIASPKQLGEVLFDKMGLPTKGVRRTKMGAWSTNALVLEKLQEDDEHHPVLDDLLEYRRLAKLLSTYVDNIPKMLDRNDRLHTTFVQTGTATGRLSSRDPNLQNIPTRTEEGRRIRGAFVASPGMVLATFDYSQIDLRTLALLSSDPKLLRFFKTGGDIHEQVACEVFGVKPNKVDTEMRRRAKIINFGIIYGMGINALKRQLGTSQIEARDFYERYFRTFPGVERYMEETKQLAHKQGYTETLFGRRRYYPSINSGPEYMQKMAERMAVNAPVQGSSADIIKLASIKVDEELRKRDWEDKVHFLLQVHDELIYEIDEKLAPEVVPVIKNMMEEIMPGSKTPFPVHISTGKDWSQL